jgi:hypothetical protein
MYLKEMNVYMFAKRYEKTAHNSTVYEIPEVESIQMSIYSIAGM